MCCNRRNRAVRGYPVTHNRTLPSGVNPLFTGNKELGVNTLVSMVNGLTLQSHQIQSQHTNQVPAYPDDYKEKYPTEEPPAYERVAHEPAAEIVTREITASTINGQCQSHKLQTSLPYQSITPQVQKLVEAMSASLKAYQSGAGRRMTVRRALKALRNALYAEEVARRQAVHGRLRCGEKCEIWREVKAVDFGY